MVYAYISKTGKTFTSRNGEIVSIVGEVINDLSIDGWEFVNIQYVDNGIRFVVLMRKAIL